MMNMFSFVSIADVVAMMISAILMSVATIVVVNKGLKEKLTKKQMAELFFDISLAVAIAYYSGMRNGISKDGGDDSCNTDKIGFII